VAFATVFAYCCKLPVNYVHIPQNLFASVHLSHLTGPNLAITWEIVFDAMAIAFIAAAETLLTSTAIERCIVDLEQITIASSWLRVLAMPSAA